jgi:hypothetical protein
MERAEQRACRSAAVQARRLHLLMLACCQGEGRRRRRAAAKLAVEARLPSSKGGGAGGQLPSLRSKPVSPAPPLVTAAALPQRARRLILPRIADSAASRCRTHILAKRAWAQTFIRAWAQTFCCVT